MGNSESSTIPKKNPVFQESMFQKNEELNKVGGALWEWQSNLTDQVPQWTKYSIEEILTIEKAFQEKKETVEIGDYVVNFQSQLQIHKEENSRTNPVRRTEMNHRAGYFCSELITPRTFGRVTYSGDPTIVEKWLNKRKFNFKIDKHGYNVTDEENMPQLKEVVAIAIKGILDESQKNNWSDFAETLTKRLEDSISHNSKNIFRECIYIYTTENKPGIPSLYTVANKALRDVDYSKVETLGPYCYLLNFALKALSDGNAEFLHTGKVYRGLALEQNMLDMYKIAWKRGLQISFHSFVSTSKSIEVATMFSFLQENQRRVLLMIENLGGAYIETLTSHQGEQEVLLPASRGFHITNIDDRDPKTTIIHLKMVNTKLSNLRFDGGSFPGILLSHSSFTELPPSLSQWSKGKQVYFEISEDGTNITPENKSSELKEIMRLAAEGIRKFGDTQEDERERKNGRDYAEILLNAMDKDPRNIFKALFKVYTTDSFLFKNVVVNLLSESPEKLGDLGPYCYLLNLYMIAINQIITSQTKNRDKFVTVWRRERCPPFQIDVFKELYEKNLHFAFSSFKSTTTDKKIVERFAKTVQNEAAILTLLVPSTMVSAFDLSKISNYPAEKEVLLPPNVSFKITHADLSSKVKYFKLEYIDYVI